MKKIFLFILAISTAIASTGPLKAALRHPTNSDKFEKEINSLLVGLNKLQTKRKEIQKSRQKQNELINGLVKGIESRLEELFKQKDIQEQRRRQQQQRAQERQQQQQRWDELQEQERVLEERRQPKKTTTKTKQERRRLIQQKVEKRRRQEERRRLIQQKVEKQQQQGKKQTPTKDVRKKIDAKTRIKIRKSLQEKKPNIVNLFYRTLKLDEFIKNKKNFNNTIYKGDIKFLSSEHKNKFDKFDYNVTKISENIVLVRLPSMSQRWEHSPYKEKYGDAFRATICGYSAAVNQNILSHTESSVSVKKMLLMLNDQERFYPNFSYQKKAPSVNPKPKDKNPATTWMFNFIRKVNKNIDFQIEKPFGDRGGPERLDQDQMAVFLFNDNSYLENKFIAVSNKVGLTTTYKVPLQEHIRKKIPFTFSLNTGGHWVTLRIEFDLKTNAIYILGTDSLPERKRIIQNGRETLVVDNKRTTENLLRAARMLLQKFAKAGVMLSPSSL